MLNIVLADACDPQRLEKFWLRSTLNDYTFLSAEQWWTIAMRKPWQQENTTTWVAQKTTSQEILGLISICKDTIHAFHIEPEITDFFIVKQLLWQAIDQRRHVYMQLFAQEIKRREILHNYGFKITEIGHEPSYFQKMIKMCLHLS